METIKTACMVIVLMAIGYGVYTVLNQPEDVPPEVAEAGESMDLTLPDFSQMAMPGGSPSTSPSTPMGTTSSAPKFEDKGFASGRLTAPQLGESGGSAPSFSPGMPQDDAPLANSTPQTSLAGAGDLPPLGSPASGNPAQEMTSSEAPIPTSPDASHTELASVYSQGNLGGMPSPMSSGGSSQSTEKFQADWDEAQVYLRQNDLVEATRKLTPWRSRPELNPSQKEKLNLLLSQLAGTVVYSTQHSLEEPYTVGSGETLGSIAQQFQVPQILLQRINGIADPNSLTPGQKLKVLRGPFDANVDMTHNELTLEIDGCYAGRFPITVENGAIIPAGQHEVLRKEANPQFYDEQAQKILTADDPANPYGGHAVHLDGGIVLHGSGGPGGSISLSSRDSEDIYGILSVGSKVTVRR
ncbi:LysM peptidoglycan-binding domain-containing protein [Bremerella sp. JC770]|uniref:LysM peptidoglycan-binding domain-containing protein n=1 Tax=Bremerella sp. JC770 TaxID=3232137 RepID=UPI003457DE2A